MTDEGVQARREIAAVVRLGRSLNALRLPAERQRELFPPFVVVADELALDFDNWYGVVHRARQRGELADWPEDAVATLDELDALLTAMSETHDDELWSPEGLSQRREWGEVRRLAARILGLFHWPIEDPGPSLDGYVQG